MSRPQHMVHALLAQLADCGAMTHGMVMARTGWKGKEVSNRQSLASGRGYIERVEGTGVRNAAWVLTAAGRAELLDSLAAVPTTADLAERALALILASEHGLDSEQLAESLVSSNAEVMAALDQAADDHRVVACRLVRDGVEMRQYRKSAGAPLITPWDKLTSATAPASEIAAARARTAVMQSVDIDRAHRVPSTGRIAKITPPAEPAPLDSVTKSSVDRLAEAIADAYEEAAQEPSGRDVAPWFCLFSSGELQLVRPDGEQVCLSADETRSLFRWLDRLAGTDLQRLSFREEVPA